jgi:hypothetical protein
VTLYPALAAVPRYQEFLPRKLLGVLLANINVGSLNEWLAQVRIENGYAVMLDANGHCIFHTAEFDTDLPAGAITALRDKIRPSEAGHLPRYRGQVRAFDHVLDEKWGTDVDHRDPVLADQRRYLAGYAPVPEFGWGALVQHDYEEVMKPINAMEANLRRWGVGIVGIAVVLLLGLWTWFFRILRAEERLTHG